VKRATSKSMDSTAAKICLVGPGKKVLGRPTLTIIQDEFSRLICGYHVTYAKEDSAAILKSVRSASPSNDAPKSQSAKTKTS
jgi:hypothetical protein